jgi:outer membrane immunogenic protein
MPRFLTLFAAAVGMAASQAWAADLPARAPAYVPPPPPPSWTGCYIGGNIGGAFGDADATFYSGEVSTSGSGFAGGVQFGCDYQWPGNAWVFGFRNMFDWTSNDRSGTIGHGPYAGSVVNLDAKWFDTLTARIGYAATPTWLLYFQGGAAWGHTSADISFNGVQFGETSKTRTGWTIGGGVEWKFTPTWSAFLEGNYMDFGSNDHTVFTRFGACTSGCVFTTNTTVATVLVGLNWRWGGTGGGTWGW